jgi:prepilin-type N-terminal cleavage/methylation domain-containing protein
MRLNKKYGFTIVELLIVVVVIAILAAIAILAFNGIQRRAGEAGLLADLKSSANKLEFFKIDNSDRYPVSLAAAGITDTTTARYQYTYNSETNAFCVTAFPVNSSLTSYFIDDQAGGVAAAGTCSGHTDPGQVLVTTYTQRTSLGTANWRAVDISGDGQKMVAVATTGFMRTSTNGGVSWTQQTGAGSRSWTGVAISDDGQTIVGVATTSTPVISTNGGSTWLTPAAAGSRSWEAVTISSDGTRIAAAATAQFGNYVHTSEDSGVTWTQRTSVGQSGWQSIDSSADGRYIIVLTGGGGSVRYSSDYGANWSSAPYASQSWWGAAISDNGQRMIAGPSSPTGVLRQSLDGGANWRNTDTPVAQWRGVDSSRDGSVIFGVNRNGGQLVYSLDAGSTWVYDEVISASVRYLACSADCQEIIIADAVSGYVYTGLLKASP